MRMEIKIMKSEIKLYYFILNMFYLRTIILRNLKCLKINKKLTKN